MTLPQPALGYTTIYAGTSTGGIIALGLAAGIPIDTIVGLYSSQCSSIFNPSFPTIRAPTAIVALRIISTGDGLPMPHGSRC